MKKLFMVSLLIIFNQSVYANNCGGQFDPVSGSCRIIGPDGRQIIYNSAPPQSGTQAQPTKKIIRYTTVNVPSKYGALATDKKASITAGSANENSLAEAKKMALKQCSNGGKNKHCELITWVRNGCYAAAAGKHGKSWMLYDAIGEPGQAESKAMNLCESKSSECRITVPETCSIP